MEGAPRVLSGGFALGRGEVEGVGYIVSLVAGSAEGKVEGVPKAMPRAFASVSHSHRHRHMERMRPPKSGLKAHGRNARHA